LGAAIHVVGLRTGRHRAWLVPELPAGCESERIGVADLGHRVGGVLEEVRDGVTFEIYDFKREQVKGYLMLTPSDALDRAGLVAGLTRARAAEQAERSAQHAVLWRTGDGQAVTDGSAPVAPPQHTTVRRSVPGLATEDRPAWKD